MTTIPQLAQVMQTLLTTTADTLARETGFVQRQRKLSGATFAQALVFSWLADPQATVEARAQTAAACGVPISAQGLEQRLTETAATFLHRLLETAVQTLLTADPVAIPILRRFSGVYLYDGTILALPDALKDDWPGCGGSTPSGAALKIGVRLDLLGGGLAGPVLAPGRVHDRTLPLAPRALPAGALQVADLGFFDLELFDTLDSQGGYWLSRLRVGTVVLDPTTGARHDLLTLLSSCATPDLDLPVLVGETARLPARLLARRVPRAVANERRRKLKEEARRRRQPLSAERLALADWTIAATSAPPALLSSVEEAITLLRARWQIEQLFALWKKHGHLDQSRSTKPWRVLCEVYAKLVALLIQHWIFLIGCWAYLDRSLMKAARTVRAHALALATALAADLARLRIALGVLSRCLASGCRINKRRDHPPTYHQLLALTPGGDP